MAVNRGTVEHRAVTACAAASSIGPRVPSAAPSSSNAPQSAPHARLVVLITVDTLRADQPWSGYSKARTPNLSRLAEHGMVYLRAYSLANTTGPSLGGMLTSRYPSELARDDCPLAGMDIEQGIAQVLASAGVWTAAAHGHPYFATTVAPRAGFEVWRTVSNVLGRRASDGAITGPEVTDIAIGLLHSAPRNRPGFFWAHYVDPHDKYVLHGGFPPSDNPARALYDGEVSFTDHYVGRLLEAIDKLPEASRTAVIFSADHGESFGEHGRWRHGTSIYEEEVRVPLMIRAAGLPAMRIEAPRSTIDIAPTIAALFGVAAPSSWRGRSLLEDAGSEPVSDRPVMVDCPLLMNAPVRRAVIWGSRKVSDSDGQVNVYDLASDPEERKPLSAEDAKEWAEHAAATLAKLQSVAPRKCARQAFRVAQ